MPTSRPTSTPVPLRLVETPPDGSAATAPTALLAVGDRSDAVRLGPVLLALRREAAFAPVIVLTGRAGDQRVVRALGEELGLGKADHALTIAGGSDAEVTAQTLAAFDVLLRGLAPDVVVLTGDSDATIACALSAAKQKIAVAHVDSGLRSWDWSSPAEINRVVIDRLSDTLLTHSREAAENLSAEGVPAGRVHAVGSTAVDTLRRLEPHARTRDAWSRHGLTRNGYVLVAAGGGDRLRGGAGQDALLDALTQLGTRTPVAYLRGLGARATALDEAVAALEAPGVLALAPTDYADFLSLLLGAGAVVTDLATAQDEAAGLGVPCYTVAALTERPITLTHGTNVLLGDDPSAIAEVAPSVADRVTCAIPLWDGHAGERVASTLLANYAFQASWESLSLP
jgi:UDP-N-acetylglucosamine 2-epimerase (non-hydrolysing)